MTVGARGTTLAVAAGTNAALASVSAKFATSLPDAQRLAALLAASVGLSGASATVVTLVRIISFCSIFLFNGMMWTSYTKSLQFSSSTVEPTVINAGSNFLVTALVGRLVFGERLSWLWWLGSLCVLGGLRLIHQGSLPPLQSASTRSAQPASTSRRPATSLLKDKVS